MFQKLAQTVLFLYFVSQFTQFKLEILYPFFHSFFVFCVSKDKIALN